MSKRYKQIKNDKHKDNNKQEREKERLTESEKQLERRELLLFRTTH